MNRRINILHYRAKHCNAAFLRLLRTTWADSHNARLLANKPSGGCTRTKMVMRNCRALVNMTVPAVKSQATLQASIYHSH